MRRLSRGDGSTAVVGRSKRRGQSVARCGCGLAWRGVCVPDTAHGPDGAALATCGAGAWHPAEFFACAVGILCGATGKHGAAGRSGRRCRAGLSHPGSGRSDPRGAIGCCRTADRSTVHLCADGYRLCLRAAGARWHPVVARDLAGRFWVLHCDARRCSAGARYIRHGALPAPDPDADQGPARDRLFTAECGAFDFRVLCLRARHTNEHSTARHSHACASDLVFHADPPVCRRLGWREGAAAALFPLIGASAGAGVAAGIAYGAMLLLAALPAVVFALKPTHPHPIPHTSKMDVL